MASIEELQALLEEQIRHLGEERQANALQFTKEREDALQVAAMERAKKVEEYNNKVAAREAEKAKREEEYQQQQKKERAERLLNEQKQFELDETLRMQREKLEWLTNEISKAEFSEEQFKKSMESQRIITAVRVPVDVDTINIEHPEAPLNQTTPGEAVEGTSGQTPETTLMSQHLRHILRQANRT